MVTLIYWTVGGSVGLLVAWFVVKQLVGYFVSPVGSGRAYLKQQTKAYGTDIDLVPDSAWNEIVLRNIDAARGLTAVEKGGGSTGWDPHFSANLVRLLDGEAVVVSKIMAGDTGPLTTGPAK